MIDNPGWVNKPVQTNTVKVTSQIRVTDDFYLDTNTKEDMITRELINDLAKQILNLDVDVINFKKQYDNFRLEYTYAASLNLLPADINTVTSMAKVFEINGVTFSDEQLQEAVLNTFPELFL